MFHICVRRGCKKDPDDRAGIINLTILPGCRWFLVAMMIRILRECSEIAPCSVGEALLLVEVR